MKSQFKKSIIFLLLGSVLCTAATSIWLPFASGSIVSVMLGLLFQYVLIILGPFTTLLMGEVYPEPFSQINLIIIGVSSLLIWLANLRRKKYILGMYSSLTTWLSVGAMSTFWGLASGV